MLGLAISIMAEAFKDKTDRGGMPYALHCLYVMNSVAVYNDEDLMIIAVLHDLIEDTDWDYDRLASLGFSERVRVGLAFLTHADDDEYDEYIRNMIHSLDAVRVKIPDLRHNSDITRIKGLRQKDHERIEKYHRSYMFLINAFPNQVVL